MTIDSCEKVHEKPDGLTDFFLKSSPNLKKRPHVEAKMEGISHPTLKVDVYNKTETNSPCKDRSKYINRLAVFSVWESPNKVTALSMY